jgi:hypothetical protein
MIVLEKKTELEVRFAFKAELVVEPTDISFQDLARGTVMVRITVRNESTRHSKPTIMRLESAPLGAFVPWRPLAVLPVPALEPGEARELSVEVSKLRPQPLGSFDRVPPTTLLTAVNSSPDETPQPRTGVARLLDLLHRRDTVKNRHGTNKRPSLAPDLWELLGRDQPHWAGNINVFIGSKAVERHMAQALRIYSGRNNLAMFVVGSGERDAYAFDITGLAPDWTAALYDVANAKTLVVEASDTPIKERHWIESAGAMMIMLLVRPPMICEEGNIRVQVMRRSSQKMAVVEFNLDPAAQGSGCYSM